MNYLVTMSGGTTQVINSTLAGVVSGINCIKPDVDIFVPKNGIYGLFSNDIYKFKKDSPIEDLSLLPGSSITGTSRIKMLDDSDVLIIQEKLEELNISVWINIGGSGTIKQSKFLSEKLKNIQFIALPKTIDNDLGDEDFNTLLFTPGYLSTIKYIKAHVNSLIRENEGACSHDNIIISQVFGRDTSHIAAIASLVENPLRLLILFPEKPVHWNDFREMIQLKVKKFGGCVIIVPEGYSFLSDELDNEIIEVKDHSGQTMWGSSSNSISQIISNKINSEGVFQSRICNTTIEQRQNPGYLDRNDIDIAFDIGQSAIMFDRSDDFFMTIKLTGIYAIPINSIDLDKFNRKFPEKWIGCYTTTEDYKKYISSLPIGELIRGKDYIDSSVYLEKYEN